MKSLLILAAGAYGFKLPDQTKYSDEGAPLHGIVGWDDLNMKPTQLEEDGSRSSAAAEDDFLACTFNKYADGRGLLNKSDAWGAARDVLAKFRHVPRWEAEKLLAQNFDQVWDHFAPNKRQYVSSDEMYRVVSDLEAF